MTSKVYIANKDVEISMNQFFFKRKRNQAHFGKDILLAREPDSTSRGTLAGLSTSIVWAESRLRDLGSGLRGCHASHRLGKERTTSGLQLECYLSLLKFNTGWRSLYWGKVLRKKTNSNSQLYSDHDSQYKILVNMDLLIRSNYSPMAITNWAQQLLQICLILHFVTYLSQSFAAPGAFRNLFVSKQRGTEHSLNNFQLKLNEMVHRNLMIDVTK